MHHDGAPQGAPFVFAARRTPARGARR